MNELNKVKMWCYTSPDGNIQTRSLQQTKRECRECINTGPYSGTTYKDYEKAGFQLHRVLVTIKKIKP